MIVTERTNKGGFEVKVYDSVSAEYLDFSPGVRVLPAQYYNEPNLMFTLKCKHEAGAQFFPNGGFEVYGPNGEKRSFDLDQVIVHPFELGQYKYFTKQPEEKRTVVIDPNQPKRGRGRPPKVEGEKQQPKVYIPTGGKRGRPANPDKKPKQAYVSTGGKRGRPSLPPEEKALREAEALKKKALNRGRGRPKKNS